MHDIQLLIIGGDTRKQPFELIVSSFSLLTRLLIMKSACLLDAQAIVVFESCNKLLSLLGIKHPQNGSQFPSPVLACVYTER